MNRRAFVGALGLATLGVRARPRWSLDGDVFVERFSWAMGQQVHLQLYAASESAGLDAAQGALAELRRVEGALSLFDETSDLCEINRRAGRRPSVRVGPDLEAVLRAGLGFRRLTAGAFNPAIEPLMRAWGFHVPRRGEPSAAEIAEAREAGLAAQIIVGHGRASLPIRSTRLDLGGIGVGYGLDRAVALLERAGIRRAFLDVSGDCFALGAPPGEQGWLVTVPDPAVKGNEIASTRVRDLAIATSSNTVSVIHYGRAVRGHVMNPATGWPADARVQTTVVALTGLQADALSTAMLVAGTTFPGVLRSFTA